MDTQLQLANVETVDFCGVTLPIIRRDEDGTVWVKALEAARAFGLQPRDGRDASNIVPDEMKGRVSNPPPLGDGQECWALTMEGVLFMVSGMRGPVGKDVRRRLVGFTQAASAQQAPAAPSLSGEEVRRIIREELAARPDPVLLTAQAKLLREQRLAGQIPLPLGDVKRPSRDIAAEILAALRDHGEMSSTKLTALLKCRKGTCIEVLHALEEDGAIVHVRRGRYPGWARTGGADA